MNISVFADRKWDKLSSRKTTIGRYFDFGEASDVGLNKLIGDNITKLILISKNGEIIGYQPTEDVSRLMVSLKKFLLTPEHLKTSQTRMFDDSIAFIEWLKENCVQE